MEATRGAFLSLVASLTKRENLKMYPRIAGMMRNEEKKGSMATISGHKNDHFKEIMEYF